MTADRTVTATFSLPPRTSRIGTTVYDSLSAGYLAAQNNDILQLQALEYNDVPDFNRGVAIKLQGGFDGAYSSNSGSVTRLNRPLRIISGQLTVENLVHPQNLWVATGSGRFPSV